MTLTIQDLGALGEFLGSIAVLATLVYLALQTRQNTMAIGAQLDAAVLAGIHSTALSLATSNELAEAFREDSTGGATTNQIRLDAFWRSALLGFQWQLLQARRGLLPGFDEAGIVEVVRGLSSTSHSFEGWWEASKLAFSPDFVAWVEEQRAQAA